MAPNSLHLYSDAVTCNGNGVVTVVDCKGKKKATTSSATCACRQGFGGDRCQHTPTSGNCNGRGSMAGATGLGRCQCSRGSAGSHCQYSDATECSGNGEVDDTKACSCNTGAAGDRCQYSDKVTCGGQGTVSVAGVCTCTNTSPHPDCRDVEGTFDQEITVCGFDCGSKAESFVNQVYKLGGVTADGRPYYRGKTRNPKEPSEEAVLYYDVECDDTNDENDNERWRFSSLRAGKFDPTATSDMDGDGRCGGVGRHISSKAKTPPSGYWRMRCASNWQNHELAITAGSKGCGTATDTTTTGSSVTAALGEFQSGPAAPAPVGSSSLAGAAGHHAQPASLAPP